MNSSYKNGDICLFLDQGFSSCYFNGSRCVCPFSKKGCEIQCEEIFKEKPEGVKANRYKPYISDDKPLTKADIYKKIGIQKGMIVADWFIPYSHMEVAVAPSDVIDHGINMVKDKFNSAGYCYRYLRIFHNVEMVGQLGIYIIGIC